MCLVETHDNGKMSVLKNDSGNMNFGWTPDVALQGMYEMCCKEYDESAIKEVAYYFK